MAPASTSESDDDENVTFKTPVSPVSSPSTRFSTVNSHNFRAPYTEREDRAILNYFLKNGGYQFRRGIRVWTQMEARNICPGRSSQSMKEYWMKKLSPIIGNYGVTTDQLIEADRRIYKKSKDDEGNGSQEIATENVRCLISY